MFMLADLAFRARQASACMVGRVPDGDRYDQTAVRYFEEARSLWKQYVPVRGQAGTVQGELIWVRLV
jgi:hypothetical protein